MLKIGLFTFGGGYAMIHLLDDEFVGRRAWLTSEEFTDLVVIAESTPGPIAINCATYIGYKLKGFFGATVATVGVCAPSFIIMYVVSIFYERFMEFSIVMAAFRGVQICVVYLIASAALKMLKKMKKTARNITVFAVTFGGLTACSLFDFRISSIIFIFTAGVVGLSAFLINKKRKGAKK